MIILFGVTEMKKLLLFVSLLCVLSFTLFAQESIWYWERNDERVDWYRYMTTFDENWRVVPSDHYSVLVDSGEVDEYDFVLQQSYDGLNWSESSSKAHIVKEETAPLKYKEDNGNGFLLSFEVVPFQSYIIPRPWDRRREAKTAYSLSASLGALYFFDSFGFGVNASIGMGWESFSLLPFTASSERIFGGAYAMFSRKILDGKRYVLLLNGGIGTNYEIFPSKVYLSPSLSFSVEGGIKINENFMVSMRPGVSVSFLSWSGEENDYLSFLIKTLSVVSSYRF